MSDEDRKKLSPDAIDDEEDKKYDQEDIMKAAFGDDDDDDEIAVADDEKKEISTDKTDDSIDSLVDEVLDEDKEEEKITVDKKEEREEPEEKESRLELDESVQKALSPYKGDLSEKIKQLVQSHNELLQKLQSYGTVNNVIKELGFENMKPDELAATMKELKVAAIDMMNNPVVLDIIEGIATGNLPKELKQETKTVSDFMPEGEVYDQYEAVNDPSSASWKAREQWEQWNFQQKRNVESLLEKVKSKKESVSDIKQKYEQASKVLQEKMKEVKIYAQDEYGVSEDEFKEFMDSFKSFDTDIIKIAFAVFAKKKGIKSKIDRKLEQSKKGGFIESDTKSAEPNKPSGKERELADAFLDWDANDNVIF